MLSASQRFWKRALDLSVAALGLALLWPLILLCWVVAGINTGESGFFTQTRIGRHGIPFLVVKLRTMRTKAGVTTMVTTAGDPRVTTIGGFLRTTKLDELPQLWNVLRGDMSLVGPRPDVPGYADLLEGSDRAILSVRPGITGPASLQFRNEERLLAAHPDPERYNREVLYPAKVSLNLKYLHTYSLLTDIRIIAATLLPCKFISAGRIHSE